MRLLPALTLSIGSAFALRIVRRSYAFRPRQVHMSRTVMGVGGGGAATAGSAMQQLLDQSSFSWLQQLEADPETEAKAPNRRSREVRSGHYVLVEPTALPQTRLVLHSSEMAAELGLSDDDCMSDDFVRYFSGDLSVVSGAQSWATPYALSIMGQRYYNNCPFGNGNGYGDGRAISVAEVVVDGARWELQLKGGGRTPFCRGADGRAVLRSSIREFLASEAMHHLGVSTTRALSLVVSDGESVRRPWYSSRGKQEITEDDPRLAQFPAEMRRALIKQLQSGTKDPDTMIEEPCAITCRAAPSFLRIGHLDLMARRAESAEGDDRELRLRQHRLIVEHALFREYADIPEDLDIQDRCIMMLEAFSAKLAALMGGWLRVGFSQGNFNADNCLVGGRTMDYGPFGWIEEYDPFFAKWTGSGQHFGFMMQPNAGFANFGTFVKALEPLFDSDEAKGRLREVFEEQQDVFIDAVEDVWRRKLGLPEGDGALPTARRLFKGLEPLLQKGRVDYTIFWRQLAQVARVAGEDPSDNELLQPLAHAFYEQPAAETAAEMASWLREWRDAADVAGRGADDVAARMDRENPKYVLREWMLADAYTAAGEGDLSKVQELFDLVRRPYDEQPDMDERYYQKAPEGAESKGGVAFFT